jgi:hypothetical protein
MIAGVRVEPLFQRTTLSAIPLVDAVEFTRLPTAKILFRTPSFLTQLDADFGRARRFGRYPRQVFILSGSRSKN